MNTRTQLYPYEVEFNVKSTEAWNRFRKLADAPGATVDEKAKAHAAYDNEIEELVKERKLAEARYHGIHG